MATSKGDLLAAILFPKTMLFKYDEELPVVVLLLVVYAAICAVLAIVFQVIGGQQSVWVTKWCVLGTRGIGTYLDRSRASTPSNQPRWLE
jgi:hypothetical protein